MLEKILSSKSKVKILRALTKNPQREFCLEDIVKETSSSFGTIHPSIKDLVSSRIVLIRKIGKTKIYKINERSPLYYELRKLLMKERTMLLDIAKEFISETGKKNIRAIIVFGSVARGDITTESDIDILLVGETHKIKKRVNKLIQEFLKKYDVEIVPTYLTPKQLKERREKFDKFVTNVIKEGRIIFGTIGD